jgi:hypothetical protein
LALIKKSMHEMVGVPESALGQAMPVSNTSGVALSIMFQPLMNRYHQKIIQYAHGLERVNELILISLAIKEPETFTWKPEVNTPIKNGQLAQLDPNDPITYRSYVHFPQPLPLDKLIALNEVQSLLSLGLESKEGALRTLGEEFPAEKLQEIRTELLEDAKSDGALKLLQTQIEQEIMQLTGGMAGQPGADMSAGGGAMTAGGGGALQAAGVPPLMDGADMQAQQGEAALRTSLVTEAYGTALPRRRPPEEYEK